MRTARAARCRCVRASGAARRCSSEARAAAAPVCPAFAACRCVAELCTGTGRGGRYIRGDCCARSGACGGSNLPFRGRRSRRRRHSCFGISPQCPNYSRVVAHLPERQQQSSNLNEPPSEWRYEVAAVTGVPVLGESAAPEPEAHGIGCLNHEAGSGVEKRVDGVVAETGTGEEGLVDDVGDGV